jgi:hypothetical protein
MTRATRDQSGRGEGGGFLVAVVLSGVVGVASIGGDCGGASNAVEDAGVKAASGSSSLEPAGMDAGKNTVPSMSFGSTSSTATTGTSKAAGTSSGISGTAVVAEPDGGAAADATPHSHDDAAPGCFPDYTSCGDVGDCCNLKCVNGVCGGCFAEGESCTQAGSDAGCCDGLMCNAGKCGTSACVPDGTECGEGHPGVVCCNDNCNGTTCQGS